MTKPKFVMTSKGYVNLALVTQIRVSNGEARFTFLGNQGDELQPDWVTIPMEEGKKLLTTLEQKHPDLFVRLTEDAH
jgi:hypothetical protein